MDTCYDTDFWLFGDLYLAAISTDSARLVTVLNFHALQLHSLLNQTIHIAVILDEHLNRMLSVSPRYCQIH
jgi:hypothetical protein